MRPTVLRTSLLVLALMLEGPVALAQTSDEEAARGYFRDGLARHEARDFDGALRSYRAAYERWKNPKILANIGTVCWELGRFADAANAYERFLTDAPADSPNRAEVERALAEVVPKVGLLEVSPSDPKLRLSVDGQPVEVAGPGRLYVAPGSHVLQAQTETGATASQNVSVTAGMKARVILELTPAPAKTAEAGQPSASAATAVPTKHSALPWILGGVGIAGLATSGVFYAMRNGEISDLKKVCLGDVCPEASRDSIDSANMYGTVSLIALGVGVAGLGASAALFLTESKKPQSSQIRLTVSAGPGQAGLIARGRF